MSSCSPTKRELRRQVRLLSVVLTAVAALPWGGLPAAAAPARLPIAAVLVRGDRTAVVVDLSAGTRTGRKSVTVTRDGAPQPATLAPVMSDGLGVALVVDTSVAGAATLPAWRSAAARFALEAPGGTQAVVIAGSAPAAMIAGPAGGPAGTIRALSAVPARGARDTASAMTLALRQVPAAAPGRRLVVLYTTGLDAGGEDAGALAAGFRQSGTLLVVVGPAEAASYWAAAAAATGGFFAPARETHVGPALDQVSTVLAGRYLVEFRTPPTLPAQVSVRVGTAGLTLTGDTVVAAPPAATVPTTHSRTRTVVLLGAAAAAVAALAAGLVVLRRRRPCAVASAVAPETPAVARGRATVHPPAQGRARVEEMRQP